MLTNRRALIVGNSLYRHSGVLVNPQLDAQEINKTLQQSGFETVLLLNATREQMARTLQKFCESLAPQDLALVYFAGHAFTDQNELFLMGVEVSMTSSVAARIDSVSLDDLIQLVARDNDAVVIIDACRNRPLDTSSIAVRPDLKRSRSSPNNVLFLAYSAQQGAYSLDNPGEPHSPFAYALLQSLSEPGYPLPELFHQVEKEVLRVTNHLQEPMTQGHGEYFKLVLNPIVRTGATSIERTEGERLSDRSTLAVRSLNSWRASPNTPLMIDIPPGSSLVGARKSDVDASPFEHPQHRVNIDYAFSVSKFPVTFFEWDFFIQNTKGTLQAHDMGWGREMRPVINVSWLAAQSYLNWLAQTSGRPFRFCTEAEWEYCCRAGRDSRYGFGEPPHTTDLMHRLIRQDLSVGIIQEKSQTLPVNVFTENDFGLVGMSGNVWEWVQDSWRKDHQSANSDGRAVIDLDSSMRVIKGGNFDSSVKDLRCCARSYQEQSRGGPTIGFRIAVTLSKNLAPDV